MAVKLTEQKMKIETPFRYSVMFNLYNAAHRAFN